LVVLGAIIGQRWGVGGVAVAVSLAMGVNWLSMAWLGRSVTGLSWLRFARAQAPAALMAMTIAAAAAIVAQSARAADLGSLSVLMAAGLAAVAVTLTAYKMGPALFLGSHGTWAANHAEKLLRRGGSRRAEGERLASLGNTNPE
jgi:hypothetical protein